MWRQVDKGSFKEVQVNLIYFEAYKKLNERKDKG